MARSRFESDPSLIRGDSVGLQRRRERAAMHLGWAGLVLKEFRVGDHLFGVTKGQFSMIDLIHAALDISGDAALDLWTWCIAEYEVEAITGLLTSERVRELRLVMDWTGAKREMPVVAQLQRKFGDGCIRVTKTHAKVALITNDDWRICIRGSMNLNMNPRFEQFDISEGDGAYTVMRTLTDDLFSRWPAAGVSTLAHDDAREMYQQSGGTLTVDWAPQANGWWT